MRVTLDIENDKMADFLNFIKNIDFIRVRTEEDFEEPTKEEIKESIRQGLREIKLIEAGKLKGIPAEKLFDEL